MDGVAIYLGVLLLFIVFSPVAALFWVSFGLLFAIILVANS